MTILEARFQGGLVVGRVGDADNPDPMEFVLNNFEKADISILPPGKSDVTPWEFRDPAYKYFLTVKEDGTGSLAMVPRYPDSAMSEKPESTDPLDWESARIQVIQSGALPVVIAGFAKGDGENIRIFTALMWSE